MTQMLKIKNKIKKTLFRFSNKSDIFSKRKKYEFLKLLYTKYFKKNFNLLLYLLYSLTLSANYYKKRFIIVEVVGFFYISLIKFLINC